ncbi:MAG: NACHT domain-containing protein [Cyanobacteria bacterium P01_D01_bin.1]
MSRNHQKLAPSKLSSLFALALTLSILFSFYFPTYSQTPPPSPSEAALIEEIREYVALQIEIDDAPSSNEEIERLYLEEAEAAGLSNRDLIKLYKQEYAEQKAAQEPGPWEQFIPNIGWVVGLLSLIALVYVTLLKKWIEARFKNIGDWIYRQGAGTRLFRNVALRKYRETLVENNKTLPMPFLKNRDPLEMSDVYVPLKVSENKQAQQAAAISKIEHIDAYRAITDHRRLMVIGEPGSGKSVLLKYLAWSYGLGKLEEIEDRPVVVLLELYRLSDPKLDEAKLIQAIVDSFGRNQFPNARNFVQNGLEKGIFLLLLDGLDEVNSDVRAHVVGVIRDLLRGKWKKCRVAITCRTAVYEGEFSDIAERKLEVVEFTDQQMRQFLSAWKPEMARARKSVNQMMAALRERPLILKLARNPLLLTLIAYLYTEPAFVLPRSRAEFYEKSTSILLEQREYKGDDDYKHNSFKPSEKRRVLRHLALYAQDHSADLKDRRSLKSEVVREQIKVVLPSLDIAPENAKDMLEEIAERSGLFLKIDGGERYIFPHLTIQEYFTASALKNKETELVDRFTADPAAWREVVKLWCSLADESTSFIRDIYQRDNMVGFECLAEAEQVDPALADRIIGRFKLELASPQADDILTRAFGAVAANDRDRGREVFTFLEQSLFNPSNATVEQAAADALSRTNLPKAAAVLTRWYGSSEPIVRMGDLAVPSLSKLASQDRWQALDDLYAISTPDAACAMVPLLWREQSEFSKLAAWYIGELLQRVGVEEALQSCTMLLDRQYQSEVLTMEILDWVWQPFSRTDNNYLSILVGRVAYLLQYEPLKTIPDPLPAVDPRLVVPLCAIQLQSNNLPAGLLSEVETFLEKSASSSQSESACQRVVQKVLSNSQIASAQWVQLVSALKPQAQLDLLLIQHQQPNRSHWRNLFQVVNYELGTGWHYQAILAIAAMLSVVMILQLGTLIYIEPESISIWIISIQITLLTIVFWSTLWIGTDTSFEPALFWELGPLGPFSFLRQLTRLVNKGIIWPGIEPLYKSVVNEKLVAFAVTVALVSTIAVNSISNSALAIALCATVAVAVSSISVESSSLIGGIATVSTLLITTLVINSSYTIPATDSAIDSIAIAAAGTIAIAIAGLGAWRTIKSNPKKQYLWILAVFSFPWFCWFPIAVSVSTLALYNLLRQISPLEIPFWQQTAVVTSAITALSAALWWRGQWLDARARNPFQSGPIGAALGIKR